MFDESPVEIERVLVVSTAHITRTDSVFLREHQDKHPLIVHSYEEGDFVILTDLEEKLDELCQCFSKAFMDILMLAVRSDCSILRLDRDGPIYEDHPTFDW